jgi:DnaK suppressor protein
VDALQQQQMARAQRGRDEATLKLVTAALGRLRAGTYGTCSKCEEPIGYERLRARPEVPLCLPCRTEMG